MSEIILQLKNPADESVVFEFLQKMGIAFSTFKQELNLNATKSIVQNDYADFQKASESLLNDIWDNDDDAEYDKL